MPTAARFRRLFALATLVALAAAPAASARTMVLKFPRFTVPPHSDREVCTFIPVKGKKAFASSGFEIVNKGGRSDFLTHHFLMYFYTGSDVDQFPPKGQVVDSAACLDFGPADRNQRVLIGGAQVPHSLQRLPVGLAQEIEPANGNVIGLILNSHWINDSDRTRSASVRVKIFPAKKRKVKRYMKNIFEVVANGFIKVPPGEEKTSGFYWQPGTGAGPGGAFGGASAPDSPACVAMLTAHMHKRGKLFSVSFVGTDGSSRPLFESTDYSDPDTLIFDGKHGHQPPLLVGPKERITYTCTHANGAPGSGTAVRLGCEETPGEAPGHSIVESFSRGLSLNGAAKQCEIDADCPATDPEYPGRTFTGKCVPANIVFGFTSNDEMCILPGAYYDANMDNPANPCDLSAMPRLSPPS
jgi:hypothetical protein